MGRSKAKKEKEIWKAVAKDMEGKKIDFKTGRVVSMGSRKAPKPPAPKPPKPPAPKPPNRRSGKDYVGR